MEYFIYLQQLRTSGWFPIYNVTRATTIDDTDLVPYLLVESTRFS